MGQQCCHFFAGPWALVAWGSAEPVLIFWGSPSDPPYLVLRHLAFFSFLKKITNFMKVEIGC